MYYWPFFTVVVFCKKGLTFVNIFHMLWWISTKLGCSVTWLDFLSCSISFPYCSVVYQMVLTACLVISTCPLCLKKSTNQIAASKLSFPTMPAGKFPYFEVSFMWCECCFVQITKHYNLWKRSLRIPDTSTRVLDNTRPFWPILLLDHFCVPVLWASVKHHFLKNINIIFSGNIGTPEMF